MIRNAHVLLRDGIPLRQTRSDGKLYFKDRVQEVFEVLQGFQAYDTDTPPLAVSFDTSTTIYGWEYMDLVANSRKMQAKQARLQKTCGSWPEFAVDGDISGIFLIGQDFGDILQPSGIHCPSYLALPRERDYLAMSIADLSDLYESHGCVADQTRLTSSGFAWHCPSLLFDACESTTHVDGKETCECERAQEFMKPKNAFRNLWRPKLIPPGALELKGAAIFGQSSFKRARASRPKKATGGATRMPPTYDAAPPKSQSESAAI